MKYYYLVSGGKDSTAMVLQAFKEGKEGELIYGDTRLNSPYSTETVKRLAKYTGWNLHTIRYEGEESPITVLKDSFRKIPDAIEAMKRVGQYRRNMFPCCQILKHKPMNDYIKSLGEEDVCLVLGLKGSDGAVHRRYRMRELREKGTFYRRHVTGILYYYPLRDATQEDVAAILQEHGFQDTKSSGCGICPIFCLFESWRKKDPDAWRRSVQFADRLGIAHAASGQTFLTHLCMEEFR